MQKCVRVVIFTADIKAIKLSAWEGVYSKRVQAARHAERRSLIDMGVRSPCSPLNSSFHDLSEDRRLLGAQKTGSVPHCVDAGAERSLTSCQTFDSDPDTCVQMLYLGMEILYTGIPIFVAMAVFGVYAWKGGHLTADIAFPALAYLHMLHGPLMGIPQLVILMVISRVSLKKLQDFCDAHETSGEPLRII